MLEELLSGAGNVASNVGDVAGNVGMGALGVLGNIGEAYMAAKAPAMYNQIVTKRNNQRNQQYVDNAYGQKQQNLAPDAFNMEEAQVAQQLDPNNQVYQQATGYRGHGNKQRLAMELLSAPNKATRATGGTLLNTLMKPAGNRQMFTTGVENQPKMRQQSYWDQQGNRQNAGPAYEVGGGVNVYQGNSAARPMTYAERKQWGIDDSKIPDGSTPYLNAKTGKPELFKSQPYTEAQLKAGGKFNEFKDLVKDVKKLAGEYDYRSVGAVKDAFAGALGLPGNFLLSSKSQVIKQKVDRIVEIYARDVSGGAIQVPERKEMAENLTPKPGDSDAVLKAKYVALDFLQQSIKHQSAGAEGAYEDSSTKTIEWSDM